VKKLWPPLVTPDYTPYLTQIGGVDAVIQGFGGSNPLKFMKQYRDQGLAKAISRRRSHTSERERPTRRSA
jgi:hypothetical protein